MKTILKLAVAALALVVVFSSCKSDSFDESLLVGKWQSGTVFERYESNHKGKTWDTSDDVNEDEAQPFTWELSKSELTQIHIMQMGGSIPKVYTVVELSEFTLKYKDSYNKTRTFTKVGK